MYDPPHYQGKEHKLKIKIRSVFYGNIGKEKQIYQQRQM